MVSKAWGMRTVVLVTFMTVLTILGPCAAWGDQTQEGDSQTGIVYDSPATTTDASTTGAPTTGAPTTDDATTGEEGGSQAQTIPTTVEPDTQNTTSVTPSTMGTTASPEEQTTTSAVVQGESVRPTKSDVTKGFYLIRSSLSGSLSFDVPGASTSPTSLQLWSFNRTRAQRYRIDVDADGVWCTVTCVASGLVLDVPGASRTPGTSLQQYVANGSPAQRWIISRNDDGTYTFWSALDAADGTSLVLDVPGGSAALGSRIQTYTPNGTNAQKWDLDDVTPTLDDGIYSVSSQVGNEMALDVSGGSRVSGANVQTWTLNGTAAQLFRFTLDKWTGYYEIVNVNSGLALDLAGASSAEGTNVWVWERNGSWAQRWEAGDNDDGTVTFISASSGKALDVSGASSEVGANVRQWSSNGTVAQRWETDSIIPKNDALAAGTYVIASSSDAGFVLDVENAASTGHGGVEIYPAAQGNSQALGRWNSDGENVQLYHANGTSYQVFDIEYPGSDGYVTIRSEATGKLLSESGDTIDQRAASAGPSDSQLWLPTLTSDGVTFACKASGKVIDIAGGSLSDRTDVRTWTSNGTPAQSFVLLPKTTTTTYTVSDFSATVDGQVVEATMVNGTPHIFLPSTADPTAVVLKYDISDDAAVAQVSGSEDGPWQDLPSGSSVDLSKVASQAGSSTSYELYVRGSQDTAPVRLVVMRSGGIRTMYVTSDDPVGEGRSYVEASDDHSAKAGCTVILLDADGQQVNTKKGTDSATIKGRGNSTWSASKKPYQIKLSKKCDLLGTPGSSASKTWVLLADAGDATLLHNQLSYKLALEMGLSSSCDCEPVDLYYDGSYRGTYLLSEKVEVGSGRVDITDLESKNEDATEQATGSGDLDSLPVGWATNAYGYTYQYVDDIVDPADITGGYLLELDDAYYEDDRCWFQTSYGTFGLKGPDNASQREMAYISEYVERAVRCLNSSGSSGSDNLSSMFDVDSLVKTFLLNEYTMNIDYLDSSTYFSKDVDASTVQNGSKLYSGPVWDFDTSMSSRDLAHCYSYQGFFTVYYRGFAGWGDDFSSRLTSFYSSNFDNIVKNTLLGDADSKGKYLSSLEHYHSQIVASQAMNEALWGITSLGNCINPWSVYETNYEHLVSFLTNRNDWLRREFQVQGSSDLSNPATMLDGYDYSLVFDAQYYLDTYPDLASAFGNDSEAALRHFVENGMAEGRLASRNFNVWVYRSRYQDLRAAFGDDLPAYYRHFVEHGFWEGRTAV